MEHAHDMPFGAQVLEDGRVRFGLWAPAAAAVNIVLSGQGAPRPMERREGGWFVLETREAVHGSRYRLLIDDHLKAPDPASRSQPDGVDGMSEVIDPRSYRWRADSWSGRPWEQAVMYELHVGAFDRGGDFHAIRRRLDYLCSLGVTAIELMPVAAFPGQRNWGYDGVLPFAPYHGYGGPDALKRLVDEAHEREMMVFLDVVYNHFGPQGNHLPRYAPAFLSRRHRTPWGAAINFDDERAGPVRRFFVENALYWLEEYRFDGLRFDAAHAITDRSRPHILDEIANAVHTGPGRARWIHLLLENDDNTASYLQRDRNGRVRRFTAQWNDDLHHAMHVLLTGESNGYYSDYAGAPVHHLLRCLEEGFAWQGEVSAFRGGRRRGEPSTGLPPAAVVGFLQNHDQIGNRALGDRITRLASDDALRAATALLLLLPFPPLLFMGQEWGNSQPFPYFCDFEPSLAAKVRDGRRREFPDMRADRIPDPTDVRTFHSAVLDWALADKERGRAWLAFHTRLLQLRHAFVTPVLGVLRALPGAFRPLGDRAVAAAWQGGGVRLSVLANLGTEAVTGVEAPPGDCFHATPAESIARNGLTLPPWSVAWYRRQ